MDRGWARAARPSTCVPRRLCHRTLGIGGCDCDGFCARTAVLASPTKQEGCMRNKDYCMCSNRPGAYVRTDAKDMPYYIMHAMETNNGLHFEPDAKCKKILSRCMNDATKAYSTVISIREYLIRI
jgi:hypothetical protein